MNLYGVNYLHEDFVLGFLLKFCVVANNNTVLAVFAQLHSRHVTYTLVSEQRFVSTSCCLSLIGV